MTLVAGHLPVYCKAIPANEHESHHIFDLLYNNTSEIDPDVVSTDTHGDNKFNFAILNTFGYRFAPRYAKFKNQFASLFSVNNTADKNQIFSLKKIINWALIESEWDNICRIMASLGQKRTSQSILIKKLCRFKSKARTLQALAEYNRALKAIYLLDYVDNETLRRYVQKTLNRGEAFHQLRRVIAEINGKQFRGSHEAEIELWNECARLIANCIIYYDALILSRLKEYFEERESNESLELLKRISPVAWQHINLSGFYTFASNDEGFDIEALINNIRINI